MTDYGHQLQFGFFPSPDAAKAPQTIELARLADVSGLDLTADPEGVGGRADRGDPGHPRGLGRRLGVGPR